MSDDSTATARDAMAQAHLAQSMQARYPDVPAEAISERIRSGYRRYARAKVRDFVPLLVERELVAELRAPADGLPPR
ncbi:hypothetical protein GCM10020358_71800 [Amorphoplanes nipponensis]|uniref:Uncharacterized protein n=1 Tax=Actinoplanes nipponensis TaxID=135950 RepID=A0A919MJU9_9ACTN|nr:hypothetical protein [Actinoplanes nipponensis]GIE47032.1 hypothetical protein Ani05nite_05660 [Actinoplanes nipponensis]